MFIEDKEDKVFIPQTKHTITASDYNQIKNEIQSAIELAGMEPEKDVIQFPTAIKQLTEQSGAAEMEKITAEGTKQVGIVTAAGTAQKGAVETVGAEQVSAVEAAGTAQVSKVQKEGSEQVAAAKNWASKTDGPVEEDLYSAKKYAQDAAQSAQAAAQSDIKNKADKDLSNVESVAQNSPVATKQDVTTASNAAQNALTKAEQAQSSVSNLQTQINSLNTEVSKMLGRMNFNAVVGFSLTHGQTFTVPSKGYLWISGVTGESYGGYASINGSALIGGNHTSSGGAVFVPVSAGDVLSATRSNKNSTVFVQGFFAPQI